MGDAGQLLDAARRIAAARCRVSNYIMTKRQVLTNEGYCGVTANHCRSPDCMIDFGTCDSSQTPPGPPTDHAPRPRVGNAPWGPSVIRSCTVPGTVALTFDDGPNRYTDHILDLLDYHHAKATFFVTGVNGGKGPIDDPDHPWQKLIIRMRDRGHQVASHTWSHQDLSRITREQRREQILKNEAALRNIMGGFPSYMRPPYSSCTPESGCLDDLGKLGYHIVLYDIDTKDYSHDNPSKIQHSKEIFDSALDGARPSDKSWLIIAHDPHEQTAFNLTEHMLNRIAADGYRAVTVGECLNDPHHNWYREDIDSYRQHGAGYRKMLPKLTSVSVDGSCGKNTTCKGSLFGLCCSGKNYCGTTPDHCGDGCQTAFGQCGLNLTRKNPTNDHEDAPSKHDKDDDDDDDDDRRSHKSHSGAYSVRPVALTGLGLVLVLSNAMLI